MKSANAYASEAYAISYISLAHVYIYA